jgi:hypothetical protein
MRRDPLSVSRSEVSCGRHALGAGVGPEVVVPRHADLGGDIGEEGGDVVYEFGSD